MSRIATTAIVLLAAIIGTGCSMPAPQYSASLVNVQTLKDADGIATKVGTFSSKEDMKSANSISLRASSLVSPYEGSYANYLAEAIKQELTLAGKLSPDARVEVTGVLLKNDVDISGFSTGYGNIEARFVVKEGEQVRYDQIKSAHTEWDSSFVGAVAIPRGQTEYLRLVQSLLTTLYADQAFLQALR